MSMVVGVFESLVNAEDAVADLLASGYAHRDIRVLVRDRGHAQQHDSPGVRGGQGGLSPGRERAVDDLADCCTDSASELTATLESAGLRPAAARFFADAICNGAVLVAVHCAAPRAWDARDILDVYNDSPSRGENFRSVH